MMGRKIKSLKGTVSRDLVELQVAPLDIAKLGEEPGMDFKIFSCFLEEKINFTSSVVLKGCQICMSIEESSCECLQGLIRYPLATAPEGGPAL
jgi:hypothetical protein